MTQAHQFVIAAPAFNEGLNLENFFKDLSAQTFKNFDLIIFDNASTDNSEHLIKKLIQTHKKNLKHTKIKVINNTVNLGLTRNIRQCLQLTDWEYIVLRSPGDRMYPEFMERCAIGVADKPNLALLGLSCHIKTGETLNPDIAPSIVDTKYTNRFEEAIIKYHFATPFWGCFNINHLKRTSGFPFGRGGDHCLFAELALHGEIHSVKEPSWIRNYPVNRTMLSLALLEDGGYQATKTIIGAEKFPILSLLIQYLTMLINAHVASDIKPILGQSLVESFMSKYGENFRNEKNANAGDNSYNLTFSFAQHLLTLIGGKL